MRVRNFISSISFKIFGVMAVSLLFLAAGAALFLSNYHQGQILLRVAEKKEKQDNVAAIIQLQAKPLLILAKDYTLWDEMAEFASGQRQLEWAEHNIDSAFDTFKISAAWVYDTSATLRYEKTVLPGGKNLEPFSGEVISNLFSRSPFCHFFMFLDNQLVEVRGAKIYRIADQERKGESYGYFLVAKAWDAAYLQELKGIARVDAQVIPYSPQAHDQVWQDARDKPGIICYDFPGIDGKPVATMVMSHLTFISTHFEASARKFLFAIFLLKFVLLCILFILLWLWIQKPLSSLARALTSGDHKYVDKCKNEKGEFGELARIISKFSEQQGYLKQEIVERIKVEDDLRHARDYLDTLINMIADPLFVKDSGHRWTLVNDAFCAFIGHPREALIGKSDYDFFPKAQADVFWQKDEQVFSSGRDNVNEEAFTDASGAVHTIITKKKMFLGLNREMTLVGIIRDITELRRQEEKVKEAYDRLKEAQQELIQSGKMAAVGQLAAGVSHELNQPLTGIKGFAQSMLLEVDKDSPLRLDLQRIVEQADRMDRIIKNVRFFARKSESQIDEVDIHQPILSTLALLGDQLRIRNIQVRTELAEGLPLLQADSSQLQQVFVNLLTNARDAIEALRRPEGGVITVRTGVSQDGHAIEVEVRDDGCGIQKKDMDSIFNPFFTTKSPDGGMGLGLAIVYRIVESHKGSITVESAEGQGAAFRLCLPLPGGKC